MGAAAAVDLVNRNAAGVIVIEQIVANDGIRHAVHIDTGAAAQSVFVDDVARFGVADSTELANLKNTAGSFRYIPQD